MTWTQGQPFRNNQSPFTDVDPQDAVQQPPVSRNYTRSNDHRPDHRQRQSSPRQNMRQQDVAATFTQEGLQTFSTIFSSAVEAAIAKSMPDIVDRAVERKMRDMASNLQREIDTRTVNLSSIITGQVEAVITTHMERMSHELSEKLLRQSEEAIANLQVSHAETTTEQNKTEIQTQEDVPEDVPEAAPDAAPDAATTVATSEAETTRVETTAELTVDATYLQPAVAEVVSVEKPGSEKSASESAADLTDSKVSDATVDQDTESKDTDEVGELAIEDAEILYQQTQRERRVTEPSGSGDSSRNSRQRGRVHEEGRLVIKALKELGRPVKTSELPTLIQDVHWGTNPSAKIKNFMDRSNGQIQRTGRGIYAYRAVTH